MLIKELSAIEEALDTRYLKPLLCKRERLDGIKV